MKKTRGLWMLAFALLLAGTAVFLAREWLEGQARPVLVEASAPATAEVVVAKVPMDFGTTIHRDHLRTAEWPVDAEPEGAFNSIDELLGDGERRVALRPIVPGEPVLKSKVSGFGGRATLSSVIGEEMRAATIRVNDVNGVAGFVLPGDRVDVLLTRGTGTGDPVTSVLLQNMKVLAIDQEASQNKETPAVAKAVTLEVTPEQAQKLVLAQQVGFLSLALRNTSDLDAARTATMTIRDLGIGEANDVQVEAEAEAEAPKKSKRTVAVPTPPVRRKPQLASVRIVRGTKTTEYEVQPEPKGPVASEEPISLLPKAAEPRPDDADAPADGQPGAGSDPAADARGAAAPSLAESVAANEGE